LKSFVVNIDSWIISIDKIKFIHYMNPKYLDAIIFTNPLMSLK
jgi:hypothetical protein